MVVGGGLCRSVIQLASIPGHNFNTKFSIMKTSIMDCPHYRFHSYWNRQMDATGSLGFDWLKYDTKPKHPVYSIWSNP